MSRVPLLRSAARDLALPVAAGLPALDASLRWGGEASGVVVVGAFAQLEVGPDAANLVGARRAADICAADVGAFDALGDAPGSVLANIYDAFADSTDDDDDDDRPSFE